MKKLILTALLLMCVSAIFAQDKAKKDTIPDGWRTTGKFTFLINQSAFKDWQAGGDNNLSGNTSFNYDFNYTKGKWLLDNKLIASYGITITEDDGVRKNDDRLDLNSILGREIENTRWYFSFFNHFKTQFTDGYKYEDDWLDQNPGGADNEAFPTSGFMKPGYLSFGPGFLWKRDDNLSVNMAPLTSKITFLLGEVFTYNDDDPNNVRYDSSNDVETYGVTPGDNMLYEFGLNVRAYYKFNIAKNVSMENILVVFSDYLDKPQNLTTDYTMNIVMDINEVLSTDFTIQAIYDEKSFTGFQVRQVFGLGLNLKF